MRYLFLLITASALLALIGCDSGDPDDDPDPNDVSGIYTFTEYRFAPSGTGFQPINVLDTLDTEATELRLSGDRVFWLFYQFEEGPLYFADGTFDVTSRSLSLDGDEADDEAFTRILLDENFTLRRDPEQPNVLTADIQKTINPSAFSDRYSGVESMTGTLHLTLVKE